jgi:hypothetical protein
MIAERASIALDPCSFGKNNRIQLSLASGTGQNTSRKCADSTWSVRFLILMSVSQKDSSPLRLCALQAVMMAI